MKISYSTDYIYAFYDDKRFRRMPDGYYRYNFRGKNKGVLLHRYIYCNETRSEIPDGFVIHHIDGNKLNNDISNLRIISSSEHTKLHNKLDEKLNKCVSAMKKANKTKGYPGCKASAKVQKENGYPSLRKANNKRKKPIFRIKDGVIDKRYNCLLDAARDLDKPPIHISECANGKHKTAFGFEWKWESDI